ncbi:acyl-CoA dehydrogenase family protein [Photobacterium halotolerans]|uniref:acyl-CoA dehydrogenase family protein n=1 Tax=Photobacterium halotolerans TaxID=265726 RepID=UPI00040C3E8D|nr:acyl-CoA dehydrogenase family protein [Photobacterium halotolerans]
MMIKQSFVTELNRFADHYIKPYIVQWEAAGEYPQELHSMAGSEGILRLGHSDRDRLFRDTDSAVALVEILTAGGSQGLTMGLASYLVSLSALHQHNDGRFDAVIEQVLDGEATISLAITEPQAGSDIAAITTQALPSAQQDEYLITGEKSYICGGLRASYFVVLAKYGDRETGQQEMGLFLVEREPGTMSGERIPTLGWQCLDVSGVRLEMARGRLIADSQACFGTLKMMLKRERVNLAVMANSDARSLLDDSLIFAHKRQVHGAPLHNKQAILHHLAEMQLQISATSALVAQSVAALRAGHLTDEAACVTKVNATRALDLVSSLAVQIFGARGCERGYLPERVFRDAKILSLGGGTTEVLLNIIGKSLIHSLTK